MISLQLNYFFSGAAPLGAELENEASKRIPTALFKQGYGMSELSPVSHTNPSSKVISGSVGVLLANCTAKIIDKEGNSLPIGGVGELCIKGPNVMKGYLNNSSATAFTILNDGYLKTGDIARVDENGYFYIVDRVKELIKYKGFQVAPAELEALLLSHPLVADGAVIPVQDLEAGELPKAFIVLKPNCSKTNEEVQLEINNFMNDKIAPHKKLRGGIEFVDTIPKTASGKNS